MISYQNNHDGCHEMVPITVSVTVSVSKVCFVCTDNLTGTVVSKIVNPDSMILWVWIGIRIRNPDPGEGKWTFLYIGHFYNLKVKNSTGSIFYFKFWSWTLATNICLQKFSCRSGSALDLDLSILWIGSGLNNFVYTDPDWAKILDPDLYWINPDPQPCYHNQYRYQ
jgi:hypothetical protein